MKYLIPAKLDLSAAIEDYLKYAGLLESSKADARLFLEDFKRWFDAHEENER